MDSIGWNIKEGTDIGAYYLVSSVVWIWALRVVEMFADKSLKVKNGFQLLEFHLNYILNEKNAILLSEDLIFFKRKSLSAYPMNVGV